MIEEHGPAPQAGTPADEPLDWGLQDFNAFEAVMWRAEADPRLSSTVVALEELDREPDWPRFLATHEWGSRMVPRFRQRVVDGPLGLGGPTWVTDERFSLTHHVHRTELHGGGWNELLERVAAIAMVPFDRRRPPWEAILVTGLPEGRAAYVLKLHHATLDGAAGMQLLGRMHSRRREPTPDKPQPLPPPVQRPRALVRQAARDARALSDLARRGPGLAARAALRPDRVVRRGAAYASSLRRVLGDVGAEPSPLLAHRDGHWCFEAFDVPFAGLRAAAKAAGASLNDAYLAAVLGGFARYHRARRSPPPDDLPIAIPVSIRRDDDAAGGNRFAGARLAGPLTIDDPVARMHEIGRRVRARRREVALDATGAVAPALARLPGPALARVVGRATAGNDLQASNIPGIREEVYVAGAQVLRFYGFGPLPRCAAMVVMVSHGETCCVTVNHDRAAIGDREALRRCLVEGFDEVLALADPGARAVARR